MVMIMQTAGLDVTPGEMNTIKKENDWYYGRGVDWRSVNWYVDKLGRSENPPLRLQEYIKPNDERPTVNASDMDQYLDGSHLIAAQVDNPSSGGHHWVVVTRKDGGTYQIQDPGGPTASGGYERNTLGESNGEGSYGGDVNKFVVYNLNP